MEHFVTLFDLLFLPQGLALHRSMERHSGNYTLWILCMDDEVHEILSLMKLPNVQLLQLSLVETKELERVKKEIGADICISAHSKLNINPLKRLILQKRLFNHG